MPFSTFGNDSIFVNRLKECKITMQNRAPTYYTFVDIIVVQKGISLQKMYQGKLYSFEKKGNVADSKQIHISFGCKEIYITL